MKLTRNYEKSSTAEEKRKFTEAIRGSSIISWAHVNLNGEYDFTKEQNSGEDLDLEKLKEVEILDTP